MNEKPSNLDINPPALIRAMAPSHIDIEAQAQRSPPAPPSPDQHARRLSKTDTFDISSRRPKRSLTAANYRPKIAGRQWKPGQEPGIDPAGAHPGTTPLGLRAECQITVVDFSQDDIEIRELDNDSLVNFLEEPTVPGLTCRWINVNGLSWDVISLLGKHKRFHRLAVEDMLNRRNRTKADWYSDHTYSTYWDAAVLCKG